MLYHRYNSDTGLNDDDQIGEKRLNYIRGDQSFEQQNGGFFRNRSSLLGDVINSSPLFSGQPQFPYTRHDWPKGSPENLADENYAAFRINHQDRKKVIYFGGNDGMLHAINAEDGSEMMAYVPSMLLPKLSELTSDKYNHKYFVDGSPMIGDVFNKTTKKWETILASGLNKGGQGIFVLDVTDPELFLSESNYEKIAKWEFSDKDDPDLGYTFSQPAIIRRYNNEWVVAFGNGYNNTEADGNVSATGNAVLYLVNARTGKLIKKIDTGVGKANDPKNLNRPNGLTSIAVADVDGDLIADYIYAGDLFGHIWKFSVKDNNVQKWQVDFGGLPFFTAKNNQNEIQAITARLTLGGLKVQDGTVVLYFGTGQFLEPSDKDLNRATTQSFYALFDDHSTPIVGRLSLLQQNILAEPSFGKYVTRITTNNKINEVLHRGWFMDLHTVGQPLQGERQVTTPILRNGKIIFTTLIPSANRCDYGGTGWLMELNAYNGSRLDDAPFDLNQDKAFDENDQVKYLGTLVNISGLKSQNGFVQSPAIISNGDIEYKFSTTTSGNIEKATENPAPSIWGRESWQQVH